MERLEYNVLLEAYKRAVELNLENDFIQLLRNEIMDRENAVNYCKFKKVLI
ncbi:sporulation histidine kinase inhibitor Sda [Halalkalibacter akibai]|uniref:Sporulation histidine kinase inhibitor Sda n=1 Tax=Halalkalibacter akibai (strain ATCC 43226 / DSM 21942 / CIP 109018 / JCM 9157 / 1139) TaxID=1236973 RepID=W4QRF7_HALA3|nr:sporulation histidine kinase inhibitor Sda [Halalkalibacter akibai]GAE34233.1 hypothetical protein JCM9157_1278 [Halalkalibacter akibai JCM 9157]